MYSGKMLDELKIIPEKGYNHKVVFIQSLKKNKQMIGFADGAI